MPTATCALAIDGISARGTASSKTKIEERRMRMSETSPSFPFNIKTPG
jgi:hypothetical protein